MKPRFAACPRRCPCRCRRWSGYLHGDGAVVAHGVHGLGDLVADGGVAGGDAADVGDLLPLVDTGVASALMAATMASVAFSMPRRMPSASAPAVTFFRPPETMTSARRVAVVVPSPATSLVHGHLAHQWAPMFSTGFSSSTSLATVTPSLVMSGAP